MNKAAFDGQAVAITGAGGSIGGALAREAIESGCRRLVMVSLTEAGLYRIENELRPIAAGKSELVGMLGSVLDRRLMMRALEGIDIVVHAAAHKHVPMCERNAAIAVENNSIGTYHLAQAAEASKVRRFVLISTDKAVRPSSVMGASKRLAELIIRENMRRRRALYYIVRFGNVYNTAGSVLPLWRAQIAGGAPVTVTHPDCTRYFMEIRDAVTLIVGTLELDANPGTFIFDMGEQRNVAAIARELIAASPRPQTQIAFTGLRPGEKLTEELHHGGELMPTANPKIFQVIDAGLPPGNALQAQLWNAVKERDDAAVKELLLQIAQ